MAVGYIQFVARELLSRADFLIPQWLPDGKRVGDEWVARNPTRQDAHLGSFKVNLRTGEWADFATEEKGTDLVSVFAYFNHLSQGEAAKRLAEAHGLNDKPYTARSGAEGKAMWEPLTPIPANALPLPQAHPKQGKPSRSWTYRNGQGAAICHVLRFDPPEGKQILPLTYCRNEKGKTAWCWRGLPEPRPLYNLDQLNANPNAVVVLTEGEKAADAAAALFPEYVTTTTLNGAQSPHKTSFTPLAGRTVWLMPDNDKPGQSYVEKVAKLIPRGSLFILNLEWLSKKLGKQLSEGYDLADAEADGLTAKDMHQAIEEWQRAHEAYHSPPETEDITDLVQAQAFINDFLALSKTKQRDKLPSLLEDKALSFIEGVQHKDSNTYSKLKLSVGRNAFKEIEAALGRRRQAKAAKKSEDNENRLQALHTCFIFPHTPTDSNLGATRATRATTSGSAGPAVAPEKNAGATGATASFPREDERPCYRVYDEWFEEQDRKHKPGVYYHGIKDTKEGPQLFDLWVCGPLHVDADLCTHAGTDFGLMLRFMNRRGIWRQWGMPMELLKGSGEELRGELLAWGLNIDLPNRAYLSRYLSTRVTLRRLKSALTVGWHDKAFVLPDRVIGDEDVFFQSEHASQSEYSNRGTLSEWRREVAARCVGNPLMVFAISAAFAGCLLELAHMDGGGFHYFGSSSEGKTTCVRAGCSVWGGANYMRSWRSTANGIEAAAVLFNDGLLCLDELGQADPWEVSQVIYFLANGQGKQRANRYGTARRIHRWNVIVLSTGEHSIETHLEQKRIQAKAGQSVRLLNVPVSGRHGAFSNLHGCVSGRAFSDLMQNQVQKYYGTAGPAFLEWLVKGTQDIGERLETTLKAFKPDKLTGQEGRTARRFALVSLAGDLATEAEITGWEKGTAHDAALACFWHWRSYRGTGDLERLKVLQAISEFIERHSDSRFSFLNMSGQTDGELVRDRAGYWRRTPTDDIQYLFNSAGLREALIGFDFQNGLAVLKNERWLTVGSDSKGRSRTQVKVNGRNSNFYAITIGDIDDAVAPVAPEENTGATNGDQAEYRGSTGSTSSTEKEVDQASRENNLSTTVDEDGDSEVLA